VRALDATVCVGPTSLSPLPPDPATEARNVFGGLHSPRPLPRAGLLVEIARAFTPRVEPWGPASVLLDLAGLGRLWPAPDALGRALLDAAAARSVEAHAALAHSRHAALVLARARPGLTIVPAGGEAQALAPLPLSLLDVGPELEDVLHRWGLRTIGDVARLPAMGLAERFGPAGPRLVRLARGVDEGVLQRAAPPERLEMTLELDWPVDGLEPLAFLLGRVLEPLCEALAVRSCKAAALDVALGLVDGSVHARRLAPAAPSGEARTWRTLVLLDLEAHPPRDAILRLTARAEPTPARPAQFSLLDPALPSPERLAETMARLVAWTRDGRSGAPQLVDTHRPGAFAIATFAPGPPPARHRAADAPTVPRLALRAFRPPRLAHVTLQAGRPVFVSAPGVRGAVAGAAGPWRASGDWWDVAWSRDEWDVAFAGGGVYRLFLDRLRESWYVEGELD
jgi:protein ImuB